MNILLLEPYFTGSHKAWAEGYARYSSHNIEILSLPGQFWKWRMHGGAVSLAKKFLAQQSNPDLLLATDMLDLTTFLALTRERTAEIPAAMYFHENQISYPWSQNDRDILQKRDKHYGYINFCSVLAADSVFFNSAYHREAFLFELPRLLKHFPDYRGLDNVKKIEKKSQVLHVGIDFEQLAKLKPEKESLMARKKSQPPLIFWNHRWEYDKNPADFFYALFTLAEQGLEFEVAILGENFSQFPQDFEKARDKLGERIVQFGYVESFAEYAAWLYRSDILPVTSKHDFFGISVVEAVFCGCYPFLPKRLSYPEIFPYETCRNNYYNGVEEMTKKIAEAIRKIDATRQQNLSSYVNKFAWKSLSPLYDREMEKVRLGIALG